MDCCRTSRAPRRQGHQGHGAPPAPVLQGVAVGARGRRGGADRDRRSTTCPSASSSRRRQAQGHGVRARRVESTTAKAARPSKMLDTVFLPADDVILAIGQENAFPWIERDIGIEFDKDGMPVVDAATHAVDAPGRVLRRRRRVRARRTSSGPSRTGTRRRSRSTTTARASPVTERPPQGMNLVTPEDGAARVELQQRLQPGQAREDEARRPARALHEARRSRSSWASSAEQTAREVERCLNCDIQTVFTDEALHRVRRLHRRLPGALPHHRAQRRGGRRCASG